MDSDNKEEDDPILQMRGVGKEIWADVDADEYVRSLRANWYGNAPEADTSDDQGPDSADLDNRCQRSPGKILKLKSLGNGAQLKLAAWRMCSFEQEIYTPLWTPSFWSRQREKGPAFVFGIEFHGPLLERPQTKMS